MTASTPEQSAAAAGLCLACGLCCNGVLFSRARALPDELPAMQGVGLATFEAGDGAFFKLPCHHLDGCRCTIYETRFRICRAFRCALLEAVESGETAPPAAQKIVAEAKAMVERAAALDPALRSADGRTARQQAGPFAGETSPEARAEAGRIYVEMAALERFLDRHFRRADATMFSYEALGAPGGAEDGKKPA